jgi:hypothetical protein
MTDITALLDRVQRLEEAEAARNLFHRYASTLDDPTPEGVAALFTEDGVLRTRLGVSTGRAEIAAFYRNRLAVDDAPKRHFIVNPRTTWVAPGVVEVASYFLFTGRGGDRSIIGWGTYLDRIRVTDGEALFEDKTITLEVGTDLESGWPAD